MLRKDIHQLVEFQLPPLFMAERLHPRFWWQRAQVLENFFTTCRHAGQHSFQRDWWLRLVREMWGQHREILKQRILFILYALHLLQRQAIGNVEVMSQLQWRPLSPARLEQ